MKTLLLAIVLFASCTSERKVAQIPVIKSIPWCGETMTVTFHDGIEVYEPVRLVHSDSVVRELDKLHKEILSDSVTHSNN